ncbi:hypothetical protein [Gracilibacillus saliphilus]|uniref:hypothetical protein n=1 Tax=Gracilibacillus saliphilus TaxID=543890 RepID=UPI0013D271F6|nr:hypothetical protein [Gracilibacillus saliphilus]
MLTTFRIVLIIILLTAFGGVLKEENSKTGYGASIVCVVSMLSFLATYLIV